MVHNLQCSPYSFFTSNEIKPEGWLYNQLKTQAEGLSGKLHEFWPDIKDSAWIGGSSDGWERVPYWLDGFIPLAFLLDDEDMKKRAGYYVEQIIARQCEDGWLCPVAPEKRGTYDMWALFLILKVLVVWHDATGDGRVEPVVRKALLSLDKHIDMYTLFGWAQTRWFEALIVVYWLYGRTQESWLLDLAVKLRAQGFDWVAFYEEWPAEKPAEYGRWSQMSHVVNQAMMLKAGPLYARLSRQPRDSEAAYRMISNLDRWHGSVTGMFTGDECLAGLSPVQGTELCSVVEAMYSLEWLLALTGDPSWGDRLERIAFNALPATFSPDMNWHQYDQQVNQVECSRQNPPVFLTNGPEANLFGVEPSFGCCTANMHQGWPKLALSAYMRSADGIAVMQWLPSRLKTVVEGVPVNIEIMTDYPFRQTAQITVNAESPVRFTLRLRIPGWADQARLTVDGKPRHVQAGGFIELTNTWGHSRLSLELPMTAAAESRPNGLHAIVRGPLVYSLPIGEKWVRQAKEGSLEKPWLNNYEVLPTTDWNYGLVLESQNAAAGLAFEEHEITGRPFSPDAAPVSARVTLRHVPWGTCRGAALPAPCGGAEGPACELKLIPYGCTNLRMTEMPLLKD